MNLNKILIFIALMAFAIPLFASNYYVNSDMGNDSFSGKSPSAAKKTLSWFSWSTTFLKPGDTIFVMNGTYTGGNSFAILALRASGTREKPIVITNFQDHQPLLKMNEYKWAGIHIADGAHDIVINGLTIQGYSQNLTLEDALKQPGSCQDPGGKVDPKFNGSGISLEGRNNGQHVHHISVTNCEIFECAGAGIASMEADYIRYENNHIYNNCWYTIYGNSGISNLSSWNYDNHESGEYSMVIRNNIVHGNQLFVPWVGPCKIYDGNGIIVDSQNNKGLSIASYTGKTLIENNVVYNNGGRGIHVYESANVDIINNTSYFNGKSPEISDGEITVQNASNIRIFNNIKYARTGERANWKYQSPTNITYGNNLIYNASGTNISFKDESDIVGKNPEFINSNLASPDLRLQETSPARNAGKNETGFFSESDINGISRFLGGTPDIGAYEFEEELIHTSAFIKRASGILVYPIPTNQFLNIKIQKSADFQYFKYSLINLNGTIVLSGEFICKSKPENFLIDIRALKEGIYFLMITNEDISFTKKVIVLN